MSDYYVWNMGVPIGELIRHQTSSSTTFFLSQTYESPVLILFNTQHASRSSTVQIPTGRGRPCTNM